MRLWRRFRYFLDRDRLEADLREELEFHRVNRQAALERDGLAPDDAAGASRRALGNVTLAREDARDVWIARWIERLWYDVRYALRCLRRQPTFCAVAVFTLAAGVGSTTTVFSIVEAELWRPLPFPDSDRLMTISTTGPGARDAHDLASPRDFLAWRSGTDTFEDLAAFEWSDRHVLRGRGSAESVMVTRVTASFFDVLQRRSAIGRSFQSSDRAGTVIVSDSGWRRLFGADPSIAGTTIAIDDVPHVIVGIAPAERLEFLHEPDLFAVIDVSGAGAESATRDLNVIGRLKPRIEPRTALAAVRTVSARLADANPSDYAGRGVTIDPLRERFTGWNWRPLLFFLGAAAFVLLLSCANVANLLLARTLARQREFAIRGAIGGGRTQLVLLLVAEGSVLAVLGAAVGLLASAWAVRILPLWMPDDFLNRGGPLVLDGRVFLFALATMGMTAIVFGVTPALFVARRDVQPLLGQSGRTVAGAAPAQQRARSALVVLEVMMALVLLCGAGLFLTSFVRLTRLDVGFEPEGRVAMRIPATGRRYADPREIVAFSEQLLERARSVPGVRDAAVATGVPMADAMGARFVVADTPRPPKGDEPHAVVRSMSPGYHRVLGIRLLAGRELSDRDTEGTPAVAVINENLARHVFAGQNPIGRRLILLESGATWMKKIPVEIVGMTVNVKEVGLNEVDFNDISVPLAQQPASSLQLVAYTAVPPSTVVDALREQVNALDPDLPVYNVTTMTERVARASRGDRFNLILIGSFAALAILMAAVGIYGAMSYAIEQRTQEFGVRLALGARRSGILALALGQSARLAIVGTVLGVAASLTLARLIGSALYLVPAQHEGLLYGVRLTDPLTLTSASLAVIAVAALAGFVPARRATRIDPIIALRCE